MSPHLSLTKTVSPATYSTVGDVLTYTLVATNNGNVTLTNVFISDTGLTITVSTPAQPTTLAPGAALTVTGTRTITQGNIDSGLLNNTATASGTPPTAGVPVSATASVTATVNATPAPEPCPCPIGNTTGTVASTPVTSGAPNEYNLYLNITSTTVPGLTAGQQLLCAANTADFPNLLTVGATLTGTLDNSHGWWVFKKG